MAVSLTAQTRTQNGKSGARKLRSTGMVPAILYGHGEASQPLAVPGRELERLLSSISVENTIIELRVEGQGPTQALIREVQYHATKPQPLHVDFFHIHGDEKITLDVPIRTSGTPVGVHDEGGVLDQVLYTLHVECLPGDIPEAIDVNVEHLGVGEAVHVSDLSFPNVKILNDPTAVVAIVGAPTVAALPEGPETEEGIGGEVEPEVIRQRRADAEDVPFERGSRQPE